MTSIVNRYFIINKPYQMVSQFVSSEKVRLLGDLDFIFPEGTHAIGRLDKNSEGLLILTTDKRITKLLFESDAKHKRTYLVQAEKIMNEESLQLLRNGVAIRINNKPYTTLPCEVTVVQKPPDLFSHLREFKDYLPQTWLHITLAEGKFHQIKKMMAGLGHDCKRLIRIAIEDLKLGNLQPGEVQEMEAANFFKLLLIENEAENDSGLCL